MKYQGLTFERDQAEQLFNNMKNAEEHITDGWNMPKVTVRYGKDIRCERVELPFQSQATYVCTLINFAMDDDGAFKKVS